MIEDKRKWKRNIRKDGEKDVDLIEIKRIIMKKRKRIKIEKKFLRISNSIDIEKEKKIDIEKIELNKRRVNDKK